MAEIFTVDTNILLYAVDASNAAKHPLSIALLSRLTLTQAALPMQCLSEFYAATTRKHLLSPEHSSSFVNKYSTILHIIPADTQDLAWALDMSRRHNFQFFDLLLCATAQRSGCTVFLTEDMQDGRILDKITIRNPFHLAPDELANFLA